MHKIDIESWPRDDHFSQSTQIRVIKIIRVFPCQSCFMHTKGVSELNIIDIG